MTHWQGLRKGVAVCVTFTKRTGGVRHVLYPIGHPAGQISSLLELFPVQSSPCPNGVEVNSPESCLRGQGHGDGLLASHFQCRPYGAPQPSNFRIRATSTFSFKHQAGCEEASPTSRLHPHRSQRQSPFPNWGSPHWLTSCNGGTQ
jgi:hypothetical protein